MPLGNLKHDLGNAIIVVMLVTADVIQIMLLARLPVRTALIRVPTSRVTLSRNVDRVADR